MSAEPIALETWDRNAYALEFWGQARAFAVREWPRIPPATTRDDIAAIGTDAIINMCEVFPDWCARNNLQPGYGLFWAATKTNIRWRVAAGMKNYRWTDSLDEPAHDDTDETVGERTELVRQHHRSMLLADLADYIAVMPLRWKCYLALQFFEELPKDEITRVMDSSSVSHNIKPATTAIKAMAAHLVQDNAPAPDPVRLKPWTPPDSLIRWIRDGYGIDVHTYIGVVQLHYQTDVSYIVDMLDRANGHITQPGNRVSDKEKDARLRGDVELIRSMTPVPTTGIELHQRTGLNELRTQLAMREHKRLARDHR